MEAPDRLDDMIVMAGVLILARLFNNHNHDNMVHTVHFVFRFSADVISAEQINPYPFEFNVIQQRNFDPEKDGKRAERRNKKRRPGCLCVP